MKAKKNQRHKLNRYEIVVANKHASELERTKKKRKPKIFDTSSRFFFQIKTASSFPQETELNASIIQKRTLKTYFLSRKTASHYMTVRISLFDINDPSLCTIVVRLC
jgi:hypothetical protein